MRPRLLLLDLDGVLIFESNPPLTPARELLRLHKSLDKLHSLKIPIAVLTHRSRREADRILAATGIDTGLIVKTIAAQDLLLEAVRGGRIRALLDGGLSKHHALTLIERSFGVKPDAIAMIDDRMVNLDGLRRAGLGLALWAPSRVTEDGKQLVTFRLDKAMALLEAYLAGHDGEGLVLLDEELLTIREWQKTGLTTSAQEKSLFNACRRLVFRLRTGRRTFGDGNARAGSRG